VVWLAPVRRSCWGRGDFLAVARGETLRFQAAFISEREITSLFDRCAGSPAAGQGHRRCGVDGPCLNAC
jgi:hypothetical protein